LSAETGRFRPEAVAEVREIVGNYPDPKSAILPALWIAQREYGGALPHEAVDEVARLLDRPAVEIEGVATFYSMYNLGRRGRRHLEVCTCLTCAVLGAAETVRALEKRLGIRVGQISDDGEYSLAEAECLNWCEAATVVQIGGRYFGGVTPERVDALIDEALRDEQTTAVAQADQIVKVHLRRGAAGGVAGPATTDQDGGDG
jgi:NADH:ubiquinone oxidoreductase subunit E